MWKRNKKYLFDEEVINTLEEESNGDELTSEEIKKLRELLSKQESQTKDKKDRSIPYGKFTILESGSSYIVTKEGDKYGEFDTLDEAVSAIDEGRVKNQGRLDSKKKRDNMKKTRDNEDCQVIKTEFNDYGIMCNGNLMEDNLTEQEAKENLDSYMKDSKRTKDRGYTIQTYKGYTIEKTPSGRFWVSDPKGNELELTNGKVWLSSLEEAHDVIDRILDGLKKPQDSYSHYKSDFVKSYKGYTIETRMNPGVPDWRSYSITYNSNEVRTDNNRWFWLTVEEAEQVIDDLISGVRTNINDSFKSFNHQYPTPISVTDSYDDLQEEISRFWNKRGQR